MEHASEPAEMGILGLDRILFTPTRPGALRIDAEEELRRVIPVVRGSALPLTLAFSMARLRYAPPVPSWATGAGVS